MQTIFLLTSARVAQPLQQDGRGYVQSVPPQCVVVTFRAEPVHGHPLKIMIINVIVIKMTYSACELHVRV